MNSRILHFGLIMVLQVLFGPYALAQDEKPVITGNDIWFLQLTRYHLNDKWMLSNELHLRRHDWLNEQEQFIIRPAISFTPTAGITFTAGYSYVLNSPYGQYSSVEIDVPENNIWQEVTLQNHFWNRLHFSHRFRLEERWIHVPTQENGEWNIDDVDYASRFRYRLTARVDLYKLNEDQAIYLNVFDEIWLHLNNSLKPGQLDRNWLYAGIGLKVNRHVQIEMAYLDQWVVRQDFIESYKGIQLTMFYDFGKEEY